jgi:hypothetical protein
MVVDNTPTPLPEALMSRPAPGSTRKGGIRAVLIGNSTMRNGTKGDGSNGQWDGATMPASISTATSSVSKNQAWRHCPRARSTSVWP